MNPSHPTDASLIQTHRGYPKTLVSPIKIRHIALQIIHAEPTLKQLVGKVKSAVQAQINPDKECAPPWWIMKVLRLMPEVAALV